jgi:hypothetical protein
MESGNKNLDLEELPKGGFGILPELSVVVIIFEALGHVIRFVGHELLEGSQVLDKVRVDCPAWFLLWVMEARSHRFCCSFSSEGLQKTGLDGVLVCVVLSRIIQVVPPFGA